MREWLYVALGDSAGGNLKGSLGSARDVSCLHWIDAEDLVYGGLAPLDDLAAFVEDLDRGQRSLFENDGRISREWDGWRTDKVAALEDAKRSLATAKGLRVAVTNAAPARLAMAFAVALLDRALPGADGVMLQRLDPDQVHPRGMGHTPPHPRFRSEAAWVTIDADERRSLRDLWHAAVADEPSARNSLVEHGGRGAGAARILARRHPHRVSGLSVWDRRVLELVGAVESVHLAGLHAALDHHERDHDPGSIGTCSNDCATSRRAPPR